MPPKGLVEDTMLKKLSDFKIHPESITYRYPKEIAALADSVDGLQCEEIGLSRQGQSLYGYTFGKGKKAVSIIAGSHADEPVGPMTAQILFFHILIKIIQNI